MNEYLRIYCTQEELRALLDWFMCSDPFPTAMRDVIEEWLNRAANEFGYSDWLEAYHALR